MNRISVQQPIYYLIPFDWVSKESVIFYFLFLTNCICVLCFGSIYCYVYTIFNSEKLIK